MALTCSLSSHCSVGPSTLDLIGRSPHLFQVVALTAQSNVEALAECALRHRAALAVVADPSLYHALKERLSGSGIEVAAGAAALIEAAERPADCVMAGISGALQPQDYNLDVYSPCVDAGDPAAAFDDPDGTRNDLGAYGGPSGAW